MKEENFKLKSIFLFILTVLVYGQALFFDAINYDDPYYLTRPYIVDGFQIDDLKNIFTETGTNLWHPLTWFTYYIDYYSSSKTVSHGLNILLHGCNAVLLFFLLSRYTPLKKASIWVCLLFIVHPLHVENVAWISARKDLLSLFFILLSCITFCSAIRQSSSLQLSGALLCFVCALLSKPIAIIVPAIWFFFYFLHKSSPLMRHQIVYLFVTLILSVGYLVFTLYIHSQSGNAALLLEASMMDRITLVLWNYYHYCVQFFVPRDLSFFYPIPEQLPRSSYLGYSIPIISVLLLGVFWKLKAWRFTVACWVLYLISYLPACGVIIISDALRADRYMYIPYIFISTMLVFILQKFIKNKWWAQAALCLWIGTLLIVNQSYLNKWENNASLYTDAIAKNSDNYLAHFNLGVSLLNNGEAEEALTYLQKTRELEPEYERVHQLIALCYEDLGEFDCAKAYFTTELKLHPTDKVRFLLARNLYTTKFYSDALAVMKEEDLDEAQHTILQAHIYYKIEDYGKAAKLFRRVDHEFMSDLDILAYARCCLKLGDQETAKCLLKLVQNKEFRIVE